MKRTPFRPKVPPPRPAKQIGAEYTLRPRDVAVAVCGPARLTVAVPKQPASQCEAYMAAVRRLPCYRCGTAAPSQCCHADEGKGLGIKTDVRRSWPGCAECHYFVGSTGKLGKEGRRAFETEAGAETRREVMARGWWPDGLTVPCIEDSSGVTA